MKYLFFMLLFIPAIFCYPQKIEISSSLNKTQGIPKFWIDINILNNTKDTLFVPKYPTIGLQRYKDIYDCYIEFIDAKMDTVIDVQSKGDFNYMILEENNSIELLPNQSYKFDYYMDVIYDLDPNIEYEVCLHLFLKNGKQEIISNSLLIPVHSTKKNRKN